MISQINACAAGQCEGGDPVQAVLESLMLGVQRIAAWSLLGEGAIA